MSRWQTVPLGEAIELAYGKSLPKGARIADGKVPVYGSNGIAGWHDIAIVNEPTIIVGRKGSAGAVQFVDVPCYPIDTTYFVRVRSGFDFDIKFLFYLLRKLDLSRLKTATGVPGLTREDAYREMIPVPPLPEQRRIVDILSRAEGIVRLRREAERKAAELVPGIFLDMFGDPATNPKGWPVANLGELVIDGPQNGLYKHASLYGEGTPILRIDAFYDGRVRDLTKLKRVRIAAEESVKFGLRARDIIINRVNSVEYLGKSAIVPRLDEETVFESNMMRFTVDETQVLPEYIIELLQTAQAKSHFLANAKRAINQASINQQDVKSLGVPIPPLKRQKDFSERVDQVHSIRIQQAAATSKAQATFDSLLGQVFHQ